METFFCERPKIIEIVESNKIFFSPFKRDKNY